METRQKGMHTTMNMKQELMLTVSGYKVDTIKQKPTDGVPQQIWKLNLGLSTSLIIYWKSGLKNPKKRMGT